MVASNHQTFVYVGLAGEGFDPGWRSTEMAAKTEAPPGDPGSEDKAGVPGGRVAAG